MSRLDDLKRSPLFQNVSGDAVLEALKVVAERNFAPGDLLVEQDREGEVLHLLASGAVRVTRVSLGSRERILGDLYAPGVLGETAVLARQERSATVRALTPVRTLALHRDHFEMILRRHPRVLWNLAEMLARRVTFLNDELIAFGLNTEAALAHVFAGLYEQRVAAGVPDPGVLPLTTHDLMARASSSRETVSRVLRKMEAAGAVRVGTQAVTLLNLGELESIALQAAEVD